MRQAEAVQQWLGHASLTRSSGCHLLDAHAFSNFVMKATSRHFILFVITLHTGMHRHVGAGRRLCGCGDDISQNGTPSQTAPRIYRSCQQVCIDVSVLGGGFVDAATLRELCHHTGGQLYHYEGFTPALDAEQLWNDLRWNLMRPQVRTLHDCAWALGACRVCTCVMLGVVGDEAPPAACPQHCRPIKQRSCITGDREEI